MADRPNILLIMQDQLRYDTVHDEKLCRTPNQDELRRQGLDFLRAYTPIGICSPARAATFSGLYPHTNGVLNNVHGTDAVRKVLPDEFVTFPELLSKAGYRNGYSGKWHIGGRPEARGFADSRAPDDSIRTPRFAEWMASIRGERNDGVFTRYPPLIERLQSKFKRVPFPIYKKEPVSAEAVPASLIYEEGADLLDQYSREARPFFLVVSFIEPHWPNILPEPYATMYDGDEIEPWGNFGDTFEGKPRANEMGLIHFGVEDFTWEDWKPIVARYFGAVTYVDDLVGKVLNKIDDLGLTDDTYVISSCDHGDMTGSHRQFNKGPLMYEEVYHIPFTVRGPDVLAGATTDAFASLLDLMPTFLELGGVDRPEVLHGRSLVPVLKGDESGWRDSLMCEFHGDEFGLYSQRMVRWDRYKFIYNPNDLRELYDLEADPHELTNLAYVPLHVEMRREMEGRLLELMHETQDSHRQWTVNTLG